MHWKFLKGSKYFCTIFNIFKYWDCLHVFVANSFAGLNRSMNLLKTLNRVVYDWLKDKKWLPYGPVLPFVSGSSKNLPEEKGQYSLEGVGEGRRPLATTISPSVPHISFSLFRQPWATTISPSVPPHLTLPGKTTFLNGIFRAWKVWL